MGKPYGRPASWAVAGLASTCLTGLASAGEMEPSRNAIQIYAGAFGGGVFADRRLTEGTTGVTFDTSEVSDTFGTVGVLTGVTLRDGTLFYSLEGDAGWVAADNDSCGEETAQNFWCVTDWKAHVRVRIGTSVDDVDFFVAGGLALAEPGGRAFSEIVPGWSVGGGVGVSLADSIRGRVELLYDHFESDSIGRGVTGGDSAYHGRWSDLTARAALIFEF